MVDFQDFQMQQQQMQQMPMQQPQQSPSITLPFGKKPALPSQELLALSEVVRDSSSRLRVIEERYASLRKILQVNEQNTIKLSKDLRTEVKALSEEVSELKTDLSQMKDELKLVISEIKSTAKKEDVTLLEKYLNLWEPLNFVTQRDVEQIVRRMVDDALKQNK